MAEEFSKVQDLRPSATGLNLRVKVRLKKGGRRGHVVMIARGAAQARDQKTPRCVRCAAALCCFPLHTMCSSSSSSASPTTTISPGRRLQDRRRSPEADRRRGDRRRRDRDRRLCRAQRARGARQEGRRPRAQGRARRHVPRQHAPRGRRGRRRRGGGGRGGDQGQGGQQPVAHRV